MLSPASRHRHAPTDMHEPDTPIVYATRSGGTTLDRDAAGGNPFATALIALSRHPALDLGHLLPRLRSTTFEHSQGHQMPEWAGRPADPTWRFVPANGGACERRIALLLVVADYPALEHPRLTGAAHDQRRVASMLAEHGFTVVQAVAPDRSSILRALRAFAVQSRRHDTAWVYSTGHGLESDGTVFLVPGDYPFESGFGAAGLRRHAVAVPRIAVACRATASNLVFFAGCRSHPGRAAATGTS